MNKFKVAIGPGGSELESVAPGVLSDVINGVTALFKGTRICQPVRYNVQRIVISERFVSGIAKAGVMEWEIELQPLVASYTKSVYIDVGWDGDLIMFPATFRDHQGNVRGFTDVSISEFLFAGADLADHISPNMSSR